jgi:hypothetical protein
MTAWDHLPTGRHIDQVLAALIANPEKWYVARDAAWYAALGASRDAAWYAAARGAAWDAAWTAAKAAAAWDAAWGASRAAARGAISALIAWDDCAYLLDSDVNALRIYAALGVPAAILLLPAVIAMETEKETV